MTHSAKSITSQTLSIEAPGAPIPKVTRNDELCRTSYGAFLQMPAVVAQADHVISWLFCAQYDAVDVAKHLHDQGFKGRYTAISCKLPRSAVVTREMRVLFPGLDFHVQMIGKTGVGNHTYETDMIEAQPELAPA